MIRLRRKPAIPTHLSHFMHLVSAYENHRDKIKELEDDILRGIEKAAKEKVCVIVEQDSLDFLFIVYTSGRLGLYANLGIYEVEDE